MELNEQLDGLSREGDRPEATEVEECPTGRCRRGLRRIALVALVLVLTVAVGGGATLYFVGQRMSRNVDRISGVFDGIDPKGRPASNPQSNSRTILAVGTDLQGHEQTTGREASASEAMRNARTDAIMLIRFDPGRGTASVISIPRDSWVPIPGHDNRKINAAFPLGGPSLLVRTVEQLTNLRIDHFMIIDFTGFRSIVDLLGGVDVQVADATTGPDGKRFHQGVNHLNGDAALSYVRQRTNLPDGDFDRMRRQQNFLRSIFARAAATNPADDPLRAYQLLDSLTRVVTVDDGYSPDELRELAMGGLKLKHENVWFLTAPTRSTGWEGDESVVYLDPQAGGELWKAVAEDRMAEYVTSHQSSLLTATPR